jgi:hypothetical protein
MRLPVQRGLVNATLQDPRHSPMQLADAATTHWPEHDPVHPALHEPVHVPMQAPLQLPEPSRRAQVPSHAPAQVPVHDPEQEPSHAPEQLALALAAQEPEHIPEHVPRSSPPMHCTCSDPGCTLASHDATQFTKAETSSEHCGGTTSTDADTLTPARTARNSSRRRCDATRQAAVVVDSPATGWRSPVEAPSSVAMAAHSVRIVVSRAAARVAKSPTALTNTSSCCAAAVAP